MTINFFFKKYSRVIEFSCDDYDCYCDDYDDDYYYDHYYYDDYYYYDHDDD